MKKILNELSLLLGLLLLAVVLIGIYFSPMLAEIPFEQLAEGVLMNRELQISIAGLVVILLIIFAFVRILCVFIRNCANNVKNAGDDLFSEIDNWYRTKRNNKFYYDMGIQIVNCLYRKNAKIHWSFTALLSAAKPVASLAGLTSGADRAMIVSTKKYKWLRLFLQGLDRFHG